MAHYWSPTISSVRSIELAIPRLPRSLQIAASSSRVMKSITKVLGILWIGLDGFRKFLHLLLLLLIFLLILVAISPRVPIVPASTALVVAPQGALVEQLS